MLVVMVSDCLAMQIADIPVDHPSCSKQHCVLQYRLVERPKEDGGVKRVIRWACQVRVERVCV